MDTLRALPTSPPIVAYRRRTILFAAGLVAACYSIDPFQPNTTLVMWLRAGWVATLLACGLLQRPSARVATLAGQFGGLASGGFVVAIVAAQGGTTSIYSGMLLALPFAALVALPDLPSAAALAGVGCLVGGVALRVHEGQRLVEVASWMILSVVMLSLAVWGTFSSRRLWQREVEAAQERAEARKALEESEARRAEAEHYATAGRLAAAVAHAINNPLAVVKSNIAWLEETADGGAEAGERTEVLDETAASVARIAKAVEELRRAAQPRKDLGPGPAGLDRERREG
jgi:signal transduction histidine kinase